MPTTQFRAWNTALIKLGPANQKACDRHPRSRRLHRRPRRRPHARRHRRQLLLLAFTCSGRPRPGRSTSSTVPAPARCGCGLHQLGATPWPRASPRRSPWSRAAPPPPRVVPGREDRRVLRPDVAGHLRHARTALAYPGRLYDPSGALDPNATYNRPYLAIGPLITRSMRWPRRAPWAPSGRSCTRPTAPTGATSPTTDYPAASPAWCMLTAPPERRSRARPARASPPGWPFPPRSSRAQDPQPDRLRQLRLERRAGLPALPQRRVQRDRAQRAAGTRGRDAVPVAPAPQRPPGAR